MKGREVLYHGGKQYMKHTVSKQNVTRWRCPFHHKQCRGRLMSSIIGGYVMVNKPAADIIHINHS